MSYQYIVEFRVVGTDHCGYCSGAEADEEEDFKIQVKTKTIERYTQVKTLRDFNFTHEGCSSGGSGYCRGYEQRWRALRILSVENIENEVSVSIDDEVEQDDQVNESAFDLLEHIQEINRERNDRCIECGRNCACQPGWWKESD